jgi:hypothetical protein
MSDQHLQGFYFLKTLLEGIVVINHFFHSRRQRNVASLVKNDQLHLVTLRDLEPGEEIVYWIDDPILIWNKAKADKKSEQLYFQSRIGC